MTLQIDPNTSPEILKQFEADYVQRDIEIRRDFALRIAENDAKLNWIRKLLNGIGEDNIEIDGVIFKKNMIREIDPTGEKRVAYFNQNSWADKVLYILETEGYPMTSSEIKNLLNRSYNEDISDKNTIINVTLTNLQKPNIGKVVKMKLYNKYRYCLKDWVEDGKLKNDYELKLENMMRVPEN